MPYGADLANRIRELIAAEAGVVEKKMFGGLAFLIGGHLSVSASGRGGLMVRVRRRSSCAAARRRRGTQVRWARSLRIALLTRAPIGRPGQMVDGPGRIWTNARRIHAWLTAFGAPAIMPARHAGFISEDRASVVAHAGGGADAGAGRRLAGRREDEPSADGDHDGFTDDRVARGSDPRLRRRGSMRRERDAPDPAQWRGVELGRHSARRQRLELRGPRHPDGGRRDGAVDLHRSRPGLYQLSPPARGWPPGGGQPAIPAAVVGAVRRSDERRPGAREPSGPHAEPRPVRPRPGARRSAPDRSR